MAVALSAPFIGRFWTKVERRGDDECWPWNASTANYGYGQIKTEMRRSPMRAHRVSWLIHFGAIPDGLRVLHSCDNPPCCNPRHLFLGTQKDNVDDMVAKGRQNGGGPVGICNGAKITVEQVMEIRRANGLQREIAAKYGITRSQVSHIKSGKSWRTQKGVSL